MIALMKFLDAPWEIARANLRADLEHIEAVLNQRWGVTFGDNNLLKAGSISGDSTSDSRYVSNQGAGHTIQWDLVNLANGVKGTLSVGHGGTGNTSFTLGSVVFSDGTILTQDNANLFWDSTNKRLGIGTLSPQKLLQVGSDVSASSYLRINAAATAQAALEFTKAGTSKWIIYVDVSSNDLKFYDGADRVFFKSGGSVGVGQSPTAVLHVKAGTASANTAPIKLTSGTVLTVPEAGTIEYDGTNFYLTP